MALKNSGETHIDLGRIAHSFNRSGVRKEIHIHLCGIYPKEETIVEISTATGYGEITVIGALIGYEDRYKPEDALVILSLANVKEEAYHGQKVMIFSAVPNWKDINELLKDYTQYNNLPAKSRRYIKK